MSIFQTSWVSFRSGRTYTLDVWLRSGFDIEANFLIQGGPDNATIVGNTVQAEKRWKKYSVSVLYSGAPTAGRVVIFYNSKRPGNLVIDDVSVSVE